MKGYIYTMFRGADPSVGWKMTDPIYSKTPTLGACMSNVRRNVEEGDYIFSISGKVKNMNQYVVGGFSVEDKINALVAFERFPENRMVIKEDGKISGNIIVDKYGNQVEGDYHSNFERRINNYIVGKDPVTIEGALQVERARQETLSQLNGLFKKNGNTIFEVVGRCRKMDQAQIKDMLDWLTDIQKG